MLREIDRPLSVLAGLGGLAQLTLADYQALGVRRLSIGGSLASAAYGELLRVAAGLAQHGRFDFVRDSASQARELRSLLVPRSSL